MEGGTGTALRLMGATPRAEYIESIIAEQTPGRRLDPSHLPVSAPLPLIPLPRDEVGDEQEDQEDVLTVPLYFKTKGKGRGKPVFYMPLASAIAQLFELAQQWGLDQPEYTQYSSGNVHAPRHEVTVRFGELHARDTIGSTSLKASKELVSRSILLQILRQNKAQPDLDAAQIISRPS